MGFLIPASDMSHANLVALKAEIAENLLNLAQRETGRPRSELVVRDIFPKDDLGFNGCEWQNQTATVADTWTQDFTKELPKSKFMSFYGFIDHETATKPCTAAAEGYPLKGISYRLGTSGVTTKEQIHLQSAQRDALLTSGRLNFPVGYHKPVYFKGSDTISIHYMSNAVISQYAGQIQLLGMVCEPFGEVVSNNGQDVGMMDNTSLGIPEDEITIEEIAALRERTRAALLQRAVQETGKPITEFVVREIFPKDDLGFNGCEWQNQTAISSADTWTKDWSKELPKTQFAGFYGVNHITAVAAPAAYKYMGVSYRVGANGTTTRKQIHLQSAMKSCMTSVGVVKSLRMYHNPVVYKGTETINLQLMANATTTQYYDEIGLLGMIAEPYGPTISGNNGYGF